MKRFVGVLKGIVHNLVNPSHRIATATYRDTPHVVIFCTECGKIFCDTDGRILRQRAEAQHVDQP